MDEMINGILQPGTEFEGKLCFSGTVRLGGQFKGTILSSGTLVVEESAKVQATISAEEVIIKGEVIGSVHAQKRIVMMAPAHFKGSVSAPNLKIEEGVHFEGESAPPPATN